MRRIHEIDFLPPGYLRRNCQFYGGRSSTFVRLKSTITGSYDGQDSWDHSEDSEDKWEYGIMAT
jgi:hypothetical protein